MRLYSLLILAAALVVSCFSGTPSASAQGFSVQVGPGGSGYRGDAYRGRGYYEERRRPRGRGEWRGERRGPRVIVVPRRSYYDRY